MRLARLAFKELRWRGSQSLRSATSGPPPAVEVLSPAKSEQVLDNSAGELL